VVDPGPLIEEHGADALRYFLLREVPFGDDGRFSPSLFIKRVNSDLANDLGNLLNRTIPLVIRFCGGKVPHPQHGNSAGLEDLAKDTLERLDQFMDRLSFSEALSGIWQMVKAANLYIDRSAPWRLAKDREKQKELHTVLYNLLEVLRILALILFPFIPSSAQKIWEQIGMEGDLDSQILEAEDIWGGLAPGREVKKGPPLFPRIEG
ncbi:class I tRNA ligase family protein, partial [Candidatus Aerophobetes bacterium]|nr:class I tRNA ligase family protein [Candidatus Aerophobetes bacterium]